MGQLFVGYLSRNEIFRGNCPGDKPEGDNFPVEQLPRDGSYHQGNYSGVIVQGIIVLGQGGFHSGQMSGGSCAYHVYALSKTAAMTLEKIQ